MKADSKRVRILVSALFAISAFGCQPSLRNNQYRCTTEDDCPTSMACLGELCTFGPRPDASSGLPLTLGQTCEPHQCSVELSCFDGQCRRSCNPADATACGVGRTCDLYQPGRTRAFGFCSL